MLVNTRKDRFLRKMLFSILNENKTVYQLYKDLVISGLVPADDFWSKFVDVCEILIGIFLWTFFACFSLIN